MTPIGKIDNVNAEELREVLGTGDITVILSLEYLEKDISMQIKGITEEFISFFSDDHFIDLYRNSLSRIKTPVQQVIIALTDEIRRNTSNSFAVIAGVTDGQLKCRRKVRIFFNSERIILDANLQTEKGLLV